MSATMPASGEDVISSSMTSGKSVLAAPACKKSCDESKDQTILFSRSAFNLAKVRPHSFKVGKVRVRYKCCTTVSCLAPLAISLPAVCKVFGVVLAVLKLFVLAIRPVKKAVATCSSIKDGSISSIKSLQTSPQEEAVTSTKLI